MSTNITKQMRLTALVLDGAKKATDISKHCALTLAYYALYGTHASSAGASNSWMNFPASLGLSDAESHGIMNGWDKAMGHKYPCFHPHATQEYEDAVELGKSLYALVHDINV